MGDLPLGSHLDILINSNVDLKSIKTPDDGVWTVMYEVSTEGESHHPALIARMQFLLPLKY
jgi:hypothetical protein